MTYEHNGVIYNNIEAFIDFLKNTSKHKIKGIEDIEPYLDELDEQHGASGMDIYELSSFDTKSGKPECISFDTIYKEDEEHGIVETTIIF